MSYHCIHLNGGDDLFAAIRALTEAGAHDGPWKSYRAGRESVSGKSLHSAALLTATEEPGCRFARWSPHFKAVVGPRVGALLEADRAARLVKRQARQVTA